MDLKPQQTFWYLLIILVSCVNSSAHNRLLVIYIDTSIPNLIITTDALAPNNSAVPSPDRVMTTRLHMFHISLLMMTSLDGNLYWPFVRGIHRSPVNSPHEGQWRKALVFCFICTWINGWVNNRKAGELRRHRAHYGVFGRKMTSLKRTNEIPRNLAIPMPYGMGFSYFKHTVEKSN